MRTPIILCALALVACSLKPKMGDPMPASDAGVRHHVAHHPRRPHRSARPSVQTRYGVQSPVVVAPVAYPPVPSSWTVPAWYLDGSNATGCAADSNTGTSATCGTNGQGPLVTEHGIMSKWGCSGQVGCPRLLQNTKINVLSGPAGIDPWVLRPSLENGASLVVQCALGSAQVAGAGTLGVVVPKARTAAQALTSTFAGFAPSQGQLLVNATHPARAWVVRDTSATDAGAGPWLLSQPMATIPAPMAWNTVPGSFAPFDIAEVDTWTTSDVVTAYQPIRLQLVALEPQIGDQATAYPNGLYLQNCASSVTAYAGEADSVVTLVDGVFVVESQLLANSITRWRLSASDYYFGLFNSITGENDTDNTPNGSPMVYAGASLAGENNTVAEYDYDHVFSGVDVAAPTPYPEWYAFSGNGWGPNLGTVYVDQNVALIGGQNQGIQSWGPQSASGHREIYGPGSVGTFFGYGSVWYFAPAATTFYLTGGLTLGFNGPVYGGVGYGCATNGVGAEADAGVSSANYCGIPLTPANLDNTNVGAHKSGFNGLAFLPSGGTIAAFPVEYP